MTASRNPGRFAIARGVRRGLLACAIAGCASEPSQPVGAPDASPDASPDDTARVGSALAARPADPARSAAVVARAAILVRPGSVVQTEPRLGVPTFLWTRDQRTSVRAVAPATTVAADPVIAARGALADYASLYGLDGADVAAASLASVHDLGTGPVVVKLRAGRGGIEIFGEELNVVLNRKLESVAISGYLTGAATPAARPGGLGFALTAAAGAAAAVGQLTRTAIDASWLVPAGSHDGYDTFTLAPAAGVALDEPVRLKRVYFHLPDGLEAAYYVEVMARTGAAPAGTLTADGSPLATEEGYAYVVSAATGELMFRKDLRADAAGRAPQRDNNLLAPGGFTYRVWADPVTGIPSDTPAGNAVDPKVVAVPDGAQAAFVATSDVTLPNFPYSMNDPWLPPGATETSGNNVDAFLNLYTPDGLGNPITTTPGDPANGDFRAQITAAGQFLHSHIPDGNGGLAEGRQGTIQQLFYDINFLHDWYYDAGFNEAAGNAQTNNFGRGGLGGDSIKAQAQDFQSFSNANMLTPADGSRPRMRMYVFPSAANMLDIQAPAAILGKVNLGISMSGPQAFDITSDIVIATFSPSTSGCTVTNAGALAGKIAMFDFDNTDGTNCSFSTRISRLTVNTTAAARGHVETTTSAAAVANLTGFVVANTRPVATIAWNTGQAIKVQLAVPATVTARVYRAADRDGGIDNQIVAHEWFHYVSNRLVGDGSGLATNMAGGLGEGWSDFNAMMLTVRSDDTATPSNPAFDGAYALATFATSGVPFNGAANHGYYFGIRRYPYSTDMTKNPLTFKHITSGVALPVGPPIGFGADGASNAEVHNTGEVWTTMLWECYAALLRDTLGPAPRLTFPQAQDRMKQYLIAALKVTPLFPTLTEARDALLAVAFASDPTDYVAFRVAFARRGAGNHAVSPDRFSATNAGVVEDFGAGPELTFGSASLDDSLGSCDADGVVDHGEYGKLTVTLRNTGTTTLSATSATVTSSTDAWYPSGHTIAFPAITPGTTATASLRVAYLGTVTGIQQLDFQIDYTDSQLTGGPLTRTIGFRTNTDEVTGALATDSVEPVAPPWTSGFDATLGNIAPWHRVEVTPLQHTWHVDDPNAGSDQYLVSPVFTVDGSGSLNVQLDHSWAFDFDSGGNYDGGVVELAVNGGAFADIGGPAYTGTILSYTGDVNPLKGRQGFVQTSGGTVHTSLTQAIAPGSQVQIRFRAGSDAGGGAAGWNIDNIAFTGVLETPFSLVVADAHSCAIVPTSADLAISVDDGVATATAGGTITYTITAANAGGDNIIGAIVTDAFTSELTCTWTCAGSAGGSCAASGAGSITDLATLPVGASVTYTATCAVALSTTSAVLSNSASVAPPGPVTDPLPSNNTANDVDAVIHLPAHLFASKTVTGSFTPGGTVTYAIALGNDGTGTQHDNPGDELTDVLPAGLTLVSASATSGTAVAHLGTNTVTWNGALAVGASATITIVATITASPGTPISNQATFVYDSNGTGTNDASGTTDAYPCQASPPLRGDGVSHVAFRAATPQ
jgi:uncharacterized repeat protein (TIGR01451 family)